MENEKKLYTETEKNFFFDNGYALGKQAMTDYKSAEITELKAKLQALEAQLAAMKQDAEDGDVVIASLNGIFDSQADCSDCQNLERLKGKTEALEAQLKQAKEALFHISKAIATSPQGMKAMLTVLIKLAADTLAALSDNAELKEHPNG